jgi:hypothetical protein
VGEVEQRPRMEGNQMFLVFTPKKHKTAKHEAPKTDGGQKPQTPPAAPAPPGAPTES